MCIQHILWRLHELNEHPSSRLGMDEGHIVSRCSFANAASEFDALRGQMAHADIQLVHPQSCKQVRAQQESRARAGTDVIERRDVDFGSFLWINRLHEVNLNLVDTCAECQDVLIDVLFL